MRDVLQQQTNYAEPVHSTFDDWTVSACTAACAGLPIATCSFTRVSLYPLVYPQLCGHLQILCTVVDTDAELMLSHDCELSACAILSMRFIALH